VIAYLEIDAKLTEYFPKVRDMWLTYANLIDRMLAKAAGAHELGIPFVLARGQLRSSDRDSDFGLSSEAADAVYARWRSSQSNLWVSFRQAERKMSYYAQGTLPREINAAHPTGYSTSTQDLLLVTGQCSLRGKGRRECGDTCPTVRVRSPVRVLQVLPAEPRVTVNHRQARADVAGEIEREDAGTERDGREGVPEIVDPAQRLDPGHELRRLPLSVAEVVQVEVAAPLGGEHECGRPTRWLLFDRFERNRLQRHRAAARLGLRHFKGPFVNERST
jgi:hypothetical protein